MFGSLLFFLRWTNSFVYENQQNVGFVHAKSTTFCVRAIAYVKKK